MKITTEGVHVYGGGPSPIVKLRCEKCNITRMEKREDIENELAEGNDSSQECVTSPQHPKATPAGKKWWQFWT